MRRPLSAVVASGVLSLTLLAPMSLGSTASADPSGRPDLPAQAADPASEQVEVQAEEALALVEELLEDETGSSSGGAGTPEAAPVEVVEGREMTLALRDLALTRDELTGADRAAATAYLARPTDDSGGSAYVRYSVPEAPVQCAEDVCVHRVATTSDAATPAFAQSTLAEVQGAHDTYVEAGYRAPMSDRTARHNGGNGKTDVYLADLGDRGVYGFCTSDQPFVNGVSAVWAYCVLDNDYAATQFETNTPLENMRVTAAHEYFHAVQFGYDIAEDAWFMEGTATWAEEEVYDAINDNRAYLTSGPIGRPARSLDLDNGGLAPYGSWSFFRHLTERLPAAQGSMPTLVRRAWELADSRGKAPNQYSLQALGNALAERGLPLRDAFADYVAANRFPARSYEEGASWPTAPTAAHAVLRPRKRSVGVSQRLNHLGGATVRLVPGRALRAQDQKVAVRIAVPRLVRGSEVRVSVERTNGSIRVREIVPKADGTRRTRWAFARGKVAGVEVHLVNASSRIRDCGSYSAISCQGYAVDDRQPFAVTARLVR